MTTCQNPWCESTDTHRVYVNGNGGYKLLCPIHSLRFTSVQLLTRQQLRLVGGKR